jgi:1-acyl-sn-glycerol-3-phosphate acyltransferase
LIRSLWTALHLFLATASIASIVIVGSWFRARPALYDWATRSWSRWILWAAGTRVEAEAVERIDPHEPLVVIGNHESWFDVFAVSSVVPKRFRFVAKKELARIPVFGRAWKTAGHISVDRSDNASAIRSLQHAGSVLRADGSVVIIFPEGTRSATGELLPFKKGAFRLALLSGVDLLPMAVIGGRDVLPKGAWRVRRGRIIVRFGEPIRVGSYRQNDTERLMAEARRRIEELRTEVVNR